MNDSCLHTYNALHHDCKTLGELHGLADAMRRELLARIADVECPVCGAPGIGCTTCLAELRRDAS